MLEAGRGEDDVEPLSVPEVAREPVRISDDVHVPALMEVESDVLGLREPLPDLGGPRHFATADLEDALAGLVAQIEEIPLPALVTDSTRRRDTRSEEVPIEPRLDQVGQLPVELDQALHSRGRGDTLRLPSPAGQQVVSDAPPCARWRDVATSGVRDVFRVGQSPRPQEPLEGAWTLVPCVDVLRGGGYWRSPADDHPVSSRARASWPGWSICSHVLFFI